VVGVFDHKNVPRPRPIVDKDVGNIGGDCVVWNGTCLSLIECITNDDVNIIKGKV